MRACLALCVIALLAASVAQAGSVVAARTLRAQTVLTAEDLVLAEDQIPGALDDPRAAIGLETRVAIYPGHPIRPGDLGPPAIVERNQTLALTFRRGALTIRTDGRALDRGGVGDAIRVMNIASKATVVAILGADGIAYVQSQ